MPAEQFPDQTRRDSPAPTAPWRSGLLIFTVLLGVNGLWMLLAPSHWYASVPGVSDTGPLNLHFVRDIGLTYLTLALAFALAASRPWAAATAITIAAAWLTGHALLHAIEAVTGHGGPWRTELFGIYLPAALAVFAAWRRHHNEGRA
ncbi:MAG: hypothetical protein JJT88_08325 [Gammaproteobacteria bacterium]|nr:hypothetical protein [Gammaproteobacteria bacterium]